jgi:hypothetical protein
MIKRYDLIEADIEDHDVFYLRRADSDGAYVLHEEHIAALEAVKATDTAPVSIVGGSEPFYLNSGKTIAVDVGFIASIIDLLEQHDHAMEDGESATAIAYANELSRVVFVQRSDGLDDCFRHHIATTIGWPAFSTRPGREMQMYEEGFKAGYRRCQSDNEEGFGEGEDWFTERTQRVVAKLRECLRAGAVDPLAIDNAIDLLIDQSKALALANPPAALEAVKATKVRALEWGADGSALTPFGTRYSVYQEFGLSRECWAVNALDGIFDTLELAKAAAQADYEQRVLSTLIPGDNLRKAVEGIDDDYMTSEHHHPGYVLIPTAKFEAIRDALVPSPALEAVKATVGTHAPSSGVNADLLKALKYVRRYLNPEDHDVSYVDDVIDNAEGRGLHATTKEGE